jgi:hypothetical protein
MLSGVRESARTGFDPESDSSRWIKFDDKLVGLRSVIGAEPEAQPGRLLEDEPELRLGYRKSLAGSDEERHS